MLGFGHRDARCHTTVVSYLALFVALGGSGYAASRTSGGESTGGAVAAHAKGDDAGQMRHGQRVRAAQSAPSSPAAAYGLVSRSGFLRRASNVARLRSSAAARVSHPATGVYCIRLLTGAVKASGLLVTPAYSIEGSSLEGRGTNHPIVEWRSTPRACGSDALEVRTGVQRSDGSIEARDHEFFFAVPAAPAVFADTSGQAILDDPKTVADLLLPVGTYAISAKTNVQSGGGFCELASSENTIYDRSYFPPDLGAVPVVTSLQTVITLREPTSIRMNCVNPSRKAVATHIRLMAIRIA